MLTDDEIDKMFEEIAWTTPKGESSYIRFARAIERATALKCETILRAAIDEMKKHTDAAGNVTGADFYEPEISALEDAINDIRAAYA